MIFSVLQKIEQGDRALGDRELTLLLPYLDRPELKEFFDHRTLLRLGKLVEHDKEWSSAVSVRLAYDVLFGPLSGRVMDGMLLDLLGKPGGTPFELCFALERAAEEGDREKLRRVTGILARLPDDEDGRPALAQAVMFDDYLALRLAASSGHRENTRHLLNCVLKPGRDYEPVDEAAWMMEDNRMWTIVSTAAGEGQDRQNTVDMLLDRAKRAGVEAGVLKPVMGLLLYHAAKSGDAGRLQRVWDRGFRVLGAEGMVAALTAQRGNIMTALALDQDGQALKHVFALAERDVGPQSMAAILQQATQTGYGAVAGMAAVLESARRSGGQVLVDAVLRANNYEMFGLAGLRDGIEALAVLEAHSSGPQFMQQMLQGSFLASFVAAASTKNVEYLTARTFALCGKVPVALMLRTLGQEPVAARADFMKLLHVIQSMPCIRNQGFDVAIPLSVMEALQARARKEMPTHEFWQRVGGDAARWQEVTNRPAPEGVNPLSSPWHFKPKLYEELLPHMQRLVKMETVHGQGAAQMAYRFAVLFASAQEAERYIEQAVRRARPGAKALPVTEASDFTVAARGLWNVPHWRNLLLKQGRAVARFIQAAPQIEAYCTDEGLPLPRNADEVMDAARFVYYRDARKSPEFARLAIEYGLSQTLFARGLSVLEKVKGTMPCPRLRSTGRRSASRIITCRNCPRTIRAA